MMFYKSQLTKDCIIGDKNKSILEMILATGSQVLGWIGHDH